MSEHAKVPWKTKPCDDSTPQAKLHIDIIDKNGALVACVEIKDKDAKFLILACNSHKDLSSRLFDSEKYVGGHEKNCHQVHYGASDPRGVCDCGFTELKAAIAAAQP